ncbi:MAG: UDP-N-acetylmuramoyl-L-alanine--D-glutamate ligase, partial [Chloroflexi bacterium]|nr:UDP-N-acetylmuramoyl-L-alanine--D-glutamate ligase [Chloroflexota bacterium]
MRMDFRGKKVTLIGLGPRTHVALARYLVCHGAKVTISDIKGAGQLQSELALLGKLPVRLSLGDHRLEDILDAETIFVTPGAPRNLDCLQEAQRQRIPIISEMELFFQLCPTPIIGITGSSGKTTTTALVGEMLRADGREVYVGGNIGRSLIEEVETMSPQSWVVLELSSFQLEGLRQSPHLVALLNITPDHLDRHRDMEEYVAAKRHIFSHQSSDDWAIFGHDDPIAAGLAGEARGYRCYFSLRERVEGTYISGEEIRLHLANGERTIAKVDDVRLRGQHNLANVLAATALAAIVGTGDEAIRQAIRSFGGLEHRLEPVTTSGTIRYFNDSIATSPHRTIA